LHREYDLSEVLPRPVGLAERGNAGSEPGYQNLFVAAEKEEDVRADAKSPGNSEDDEVSPSVYSLAITAGKRLGVARCRQ
jgi:hypothetical protein